MTKSQFFKKLMSLMLATLMALSIIPLGLIDGVDFGIKAEAAYGNMDSQYSYPIRKIATTGQPFNSNHRGIDLSISKGTAVYPVKSGVVKKVYSGCKNYNGANNKTGKDCKAVGCTQKNKTKMAGKHYKAGYYCNYGFGNGVVILHDDGKYSFYAHLNTVSVKVGDKVTQNTKIGEVGSAGCSTGPHLHFAISNKESGGTFESPFKYFFPGFTVKLTNNGSGSQNPKLTIEFPWKDFKTSKCLISFGTSSTALNKTTSDSNFTSANCYYNLGSKFGSLTKGQTYYFKISITKDNVTYNSSVYSFVAASGDKTFLDYSKVSTTTPVLTNPSITYKDETGITNTFCQVNFKINNPSNLKITERGIRIKVNGKSSWEKVYPEPISFTQSTINSWFSIGKGKEVDYSLTPGTTYEYQCYCKYNGKEYAAKAVHFTTTGTAPATTVTVKFDGNGGTPSASSVTFNIGKMYDNPMPSATRNGYAFRGWYTEKTDGKGSKMLRGSTVSSSYTTLYAHWDKNDTKVLIKPTDAQGIQVGKVYRIYNKNSGLPLTASGTADKSQIIQSVWKDDDYQLWRLNKIDENGYYGFINVKTEKAMDVDFNNTFGFGNVLQIYNAHGNDSQKFSLIRRGSDSNHVYYSIHVKSSGRCLDVSGRSKEPGTVIKQWDFQDLDHQYFYFEEAVHKHTMGSYFTVEPSCEQDGYTSFKCTTCGEQIVTDVKTALGHDYKITEVIEPTCTQGGYTIKTCSRCHQSIEDDITEQSDHVISIDEVIDPTCVSDGVIKYVCSVCGTSLFWKKQERIGKHIDNDDDNICDNCSAIIDEYLINENTVSLIFDDDVYYVGSVYTGKAIKPKISVYNYGDILTEGTDYKLTFSNNKNVGTATVSVTGKGDYYGTYTAHFEIVLKSVQGLIGLVENYDHIDMCWDAVKGAKSYTAYYTDGNQWYSMPGITEIGCSIENLEPSTEYKIIIVPYAVSSFVDDDFMSDEIFQYENLHVFNLKTISAKPIEIISASNITDKSVKLSWTKISDAKEYYILQDCEWGWDDIGTSNSNSFTVKNLKPNTTYRFNVGYYNKSGDYNCSEDIVVKTKFGQVTGLKQAAVTATTMKLSWTKVSGAKYYQVQYSTDGKTWSNATKATTATSYTIKNLKAGTKYYFRVRALNSTKKLAGAYSSTLTKWTLCAAPTISKLSSTKSKTATVTWKKVAGASSYIVFKSTDGKKWTKVTQTTKLTYNLTKLTGGKRIYVKVQAQNADKLNGAFSASKYITVKK